MKVETSKSKENSKADLKLNKIENSTLHSLNQTKTLNSQPPATNGAFAKILEEAKQDSRNGKTQAHSEKSGENVSDPSSSQSEKEITRHSPEKNELEKERSGNKRDQSGEQNQDENGFASPFFNPQNLSRMNSEFSAPPARSILHIADLERIISTVRAEKFQMGSQALITLKNSVLEGLQIRLTISENGKLKAEFLALNELIKKQIESRKKELKEIFRGRSLQLSEIEVLIEEKSK